ncbi:MAG: sorting protein, partial [Verrucomicrobiota bacterium]|nr:sorting protein [Verrucomicrobiota bacterium]
MIRWAPFLRAGLCFIALLSAAKPALAQVIPPGTYTGQINGDTINAAVVYVDAGAFFASSTLSLTGSAGVYWRQVGSLNGMTITQGNGTYIYLSGASRGLTLNGATSLTGTVSVYSDGSAGTAITNQGTITHTGGNGEIYAANFTNAGTVTANGGTLYLNYPSAGYSATNTGTVTADGASTTVYLRGNFDNNGTLTAQNSGTLL